MNLSSARQRSADLIVAAVLGAGALVLGLAGAGHWLHNDGMRSLFGLPVVLFLPGYALTALAFPQHRPGIVERFVLAIGLSLAVAILGGLILHWTPWGLQADSWAVLLGSITVAASMLALANENMRNGPVRSWRNLALRPSQGILFGLAILTVSGAIWLARTGAVQGQTQSFTQLWMLPAGESDPSAVRVGIHNLERAMVKYRLQVQAGGYVLNTLGKLEPGESWDTTVRLPASLVSAGPVVATLYRAEVPDTVYRQAVLWNGDFQAEEGHVLTPGFSELWMLPADGSNPNAVRLGITNMEQTAMQYRLKVQTGNYVAADTVGKLQPGEQWQTTLTLPASQASEPVEALLYRAESPDTVYRRVVLNREN